jgi:hypothetical protein
MYDIAILKLKWHDCLNESQIVEIEWAFNRVKKANNLTIYGYPQSNNNDSL